MFSNLTIPLIISNLNLTMKSRNRNPLIHLNSNKLKTKLRLQVPIIRATIGFSTVVATKRIRKITKQDGPHGTFWVRRKKMNWRR